MTNNNETAQSLREESVRIDPPSETPPLDPVGSPAQEVTSEAAQEAHEAALASHRTILKDGMTLSLNSDPDKPDDEG